MSASRSDNQAGIATMGQVMPHAGIPAPSAGRGAESADPPPGDLWDRFAGQVTRRESALAVDDGHAAWTYGELASRAETLAGAIVNAIGDEPALVALLFRLGTPAIGAMMGVIRSGHAYVALDPSHPEAWLREQLTRLEVSLVLTTPGRVEPVAAFAPSGVRVLAFDSAERRVGPGPPRREADPDRPACILSTSGSTGAPKAAIKTHAALLLSARHYIDAAGAAADDRFLVLAPLGFMASIPPILCSLLTGASLHPFDIAGRGVEALPRWIGEGRITVYHSVPTLLRRLAHPAPDPSCLRTVRLVRLAGETVRPSDVRLVRTLFPGPAALQILMGAAETSLITQHQIGPDDPIPQGPVPVGRPAAGVEVRLLDDSGMEVGRGLPGRLHVRGRTISPGYWRNPAATSEAFTRDPLDGRVWTYRGSDLCRWRPDGLLELLGRSEDLVKIRGVRVDPAAVEAAMVELPGVRDAAVVARPGPKGEDRLVAYAVASPGAPLAPGPLREALRARLPGAMIPARFLVLDALPLTGSGKVDRRALPEPPAPTRPRWRRPRDNVESHVAEAWERALGVERVGLDDRFSELGGTSLEAVQVLLHLEGIMARTLQDSAIAMNDRMEDLAAAVARENVAPGALVALKPGGAKRPFFCVHSALGTVGAYGPLSAALDPDRPFYALQSPGLSTGEWPRASIEAMAERYLREVVAVDPTGPYLLGGVCMGGLVAWEMARRLAASGRPVALVALIETNGPGPRPGRTPASDIAFAARHALRVARWSASTALARARTAPPPPSWWPAWRQFVSYANVAASRKHTPARYGGAVSIFLGTADPEHPGLDRRLAMRGLADGPVQTAFVPGGHHDICHGSHIQTLADTLRAMLDAAEGSGASQAAPPPRA